MHEYKKSYLGKLRKIIGKRKIIITVARAIIRDENEEVLFIRRRDNKEWGFPGGSQELEDSIFDCLKREVREETGLLVNSALPMAIYSAPRFSVVTAYGDPYQLLVVQFLISDWSGELERVTWETIDAKFFDIEKPPELPQRHEEILSDLKDYSGVFIVK